jgi:hypothetical protein
LSHQLLHFAARIAKLLFRKSAWKFGRPSHFQKVFEFCRRFQGVLSAPTEAAFRQNVWHFGAKDRCRNTDEFPVPVTASLIGRLMAIREMA